MVSSTSAWGCNCLAGCEDAAKLSGVQVPICVMVRHWSCSKTWSLHLALMDAAAHSIMGFKSFLTEAACVIHGAEHRERGAEWVLHPLTTGKKF